MVTWIQHAAHDFLVHAKEAGESEARKPAIPKCKHERSFGGHVRRNRHKVLARAARAWRRDRLTVADSPRDRLFKSACSFGQSGRLVGAGSKARGNIPERNYDFAVTIRQQPGGIKEPNVRSLCEIALHLRQYRTQMSDDQVVGAKTRTVLKKTAVAAKDSSRHVAHVDLPGDGCGDDCVSKFLQQRNGIADFDDDSFEVGDLLFKKLHNRPLLSLWR